jgi:hypothetical protein
MGFPDLFKKYGMFPGSDQRVTFSNASQSRSESAVAVNPTGCGFPGVREIINHYSEIANA